jgi:hypothetical protein
MIDLLLLVVFNSLYIFGIKTITYYDVEVTDTQEKIIDKMVFWKLRYWSIKYIGVYWSKPLLLCTPCMASVHGLYFYFIFSDKNLIVLPFYLVILAGFNYIVSKYVE